MNNNKFEIAGTLKMTLTDSNGSVKMAREIKNLVVNTGLGYVIDRMHGVIGTDALPIINAIAVGSDSTSKAVNQVQLGKEINRQPTTVEKTAFNKLKYSATFLPGVGDGTINEAGLFNNKTASTTVGNMNLMFSRTTFGTVTKEPNDTLTIVWEIEVMQ